MKRAPLIVVLLVFVLAGAGLFSATRGRDTPGARIESGFAALGQSDFAGAATSFDLALQTLLPTDPEHGRASMGLVEALAHIEPDRARERFLAYVESAPEPRPGEFRRAATWIHQGGGSSAAVVVLDAGIERFPGSGADFEEQKRRVLADVEDPEEIASLKGLGYLGGD